MKYDASWWGVWLVAETPRDHALLRELHTAIVGQKSGYESGEPHFETDPEMEREEGVPVGALVLPR